MSTLPPAEPFPAEYAARPPDVRNGMAIAALVLGILGVVTFFPVLGLIGLILGIIALVRANALPTHAGRGMAIAGICCSGASLALFPAEVAILLPSLSHAREIAKRAVCASNLRGIGQALKVYANDNLDWYPVTPFSEPAATLGSTMEVTFIGQMGAHLTEPPAPEHYAAVHPSRALFLLVTDGSCTPKQFICLSSNDAEDDLRHQSGGIATAAQPGANRFDFRGYPFVSYGYQLPFGPHARPNENLDPRTAIMADKGPFFDAGPPTATGAVPDAAKAAFPPGSLVVLPGAADAHAVAQLKDKDWQRYNSPNHGGEGQNVLFVDGHVAFMKKPIVGVDYDNIYTQQSGFTLEQILLGRSPRDRDGPLTETDSIIVP